jgi:hypothetical protein
MNAPDLVLTGLRGRVPAGQPAPGAAPWTWRQVDLGDGQVPRWRAIAQALAESPALWQDAGHVLVLADDVEIGATGVGELFHVMRQCELQVAQPSLAWRSHFAEPTALHNPSFLLRHTNRLDLAAVAFSAAALRRWLPWLAALPDTAALARLLPLACDDPLRATAVVDAVQVERTAPAAEAEFAEPEWAGELQADGPHREAAACWGGISLRGRAVSLFDDTREEFLGLLAAGYACAVPEPQPIGEVFLQHFARSLEPAPQPLRLPSPRADAGAAPAGPRSVLVIGAGRSGTSCLAGMFDDATHRHAHGLYLPAVSNPKGYFEANHINSLNASMLLMSSVTHLGAERTRALLQGFDLHQLWLARFPDAMPAAWNDEHRREIARAVAATPFCLKDPRMAITAPAWLEQAPDALVLSIHRPPAVTAESILRECRVAAYLLDFRISAKDAFAVWRQAYRRAVKLYRGGADVLFLRYDDLFDAERLDHLEAHVGAPLKRSFPERSLNRTQPHMQVDAELQALEALLDALAALSFAGQRAQAHELIDAFLARWPDQAPAGLAPASRPAELA